MLHAKTSQAIKGVPRLRQRGLAVSEQAHVLEEFVSARDRHDAFCRISLHKRIPRDLAGFDVSKVGLQRTQHCVGNADARYPKGIKPIAKKIRNAIETGLLGNGFYALGSTEGGQSQHCMKTPCEPVATLPRGAEGREKLPCVRRSDFGRPCPCKQSAVG